MDIEKEQKEVKNQLEKEVKNQLENNFYLAIINELKSTTNLNKIKKKLNLSKQNLGYYLRQLKEQGYIIKKGRGWYEPTDRSKNLTKYDSILSKDISRGHAYIWNVELPKEIKGWEKRIEILKQKDINFKLVGALRTTPRIKSLGRKVWLCNDHIRIFDTKKKSYYGETAIESRKQGFLELLDIIRVLENKLGFFFRPFKYSFQREHYALIKNDLAIEHNKKGIIIKIKDETGEWLLIDDSLGEGGELENIGKRAFQTNIPMQKWWNDNKKQNFQVTPTFILNTMDGIQQNQLVFDRNMKSHLEILGKLGNAIDKLTEEIERFRK